MKKLLLVISMLMLLFAGCGSYIPIKQKFPKPPVELRYALKLDTLKYGSYTKDMLKINAENVLKHNELSDNWNILIDWLKDMITLDNQ